MGKKGSDQLMKLKICKFYRSASHNTSNERDILKISLEISGFVLGDFKWKMPVDPAAMMKLQQTQ